MKLRQYTPTDTTSWDAFCLGAFQATFLHTRQFLGYHGDRFQDVSLIIENENKYIGIFPAALHPTDNTCVVSHPGITFGGILHNGNLRGAEMISAFELIRQYYANEGYKKIIYKSVPSIYHKVPAFDDSYALFRIGASRIRCDLSSTIDLANRTPVSERRKRSLKKAIKAGVSVVDDKHMLAKLWDVLSENLARKHNATPTHSLAEITHLSDLFEENIRCICGIKDNNVIAGVVLFITPTCFHAQYIASNEEGYSVSALDIIFDYCINLANKAGVRWFDFGICNENGGTYLNEGLYRYKSEFGGGGIVHEFFEILC